MDDMTDRLHEALVETFDIVAERMPDAWLERRNGYVVVSVPSFPIPLANAVWVNGPDEAAVVKALAPALAEIRARGPDPGVVVIEGRTPAIETEARRLGFDRVEEIPGMIATAGSYVPPADPPGLELVRVGGDEELLRAALDLTARGFEAPTEPFASYFATAAGSEPIDLWLGYAGDEPVSTATGCPTAEAVGVFNVATPAEHRRRGYGAWMTAHVVRRGLDAGASFAYLQSSEMGLRVYERLGFERLATYRLLTRPISG